MKSIEGLAEEIPEGLQRLNKRTLRRGARLLHLATGQMLEKSIMLPAAAENIPDPVMRNQLERLTP